MPSENKPNVVVVSNTAGGGARSADKDAILKIPKIKADAGTLLTIGGLIVVVGGGYYVLTQLPGIINSLYPPATATSGAMISGAGIAPAPIQTPLPVYPGTGAGSYPAPALTNPVTGIPTPPYTGIPGQIPGYVPQTPSPYGGVNQQIPGTYPATTPAGIQQSYHAVINDEAYLDHHGRKRRFIGERHIKEIIGSSEDDDDQVFDLIEGQ